MDASGWLIGLAIAALAVGYVVLERKATQWTLSRPEEVQELGYLRNWWRKRKQRRAGELDRVSAPAAPRERPRGTRADPP